MELFPALPYTMGCIAGHNQSQESTRGCYSDDGVRAVCSWRDKEKQDKPQVGIE